MRVQMLGWLVILLFLSLLAFVYRSMGDEPIKSVDFEVHGNVQGVFFRDNTRKTARQYGCVGWVKNTYSGTVQGQVQGPQKAIDNMKHWLSKVGSPMSTITKCDFTNEKTIDKTTHTNFTIKGGY